MRTRTLTLRRTFRASPAEVFQAFVSAEALREWWSCAGYVTVEAQADVRVGGRYSVVMRPDHGSETVHVHGVYREISPPNKIVFTHAFERQAGDSMSDRLGLGDHQTLVSVEFKALGDGATELILVQENIPSPAAEDFVQVGWQGILDKLARYLDRLER